MPHSWQTCLITPISLWGFMIYGYLWYLYRTPVVRRASKPPPAVLVSRLCLVLRAKKDRRLLRQSSEESGLKKPQGLLGICLGCSMRIFFWELMSFLIVGSHLFYCFWRFCLMFGDMLNRLWTSFNAKSSGETLVNSNLGYRQAIFAFVAMLQLADGVFMWYYPLVI